ncbi:MAG: Ferri-bacillibactin esterase BesA [Bacteroidetes bacterium ADurb.BinA245]|jgi:predicted alpha/beta superfamily hydrolase|nr:MAG: Ferri-bacillibactin esterase BesA [Bacteroidetes bacterium ADurb.BinA245]
MNFVKSLLLILILICHSNGNTQLHTDSLPQYDSFTIASKQVSEIRKINVWTPADYQSSQKTYPVLYMLDGGTQEDFPHLANTLAALIDAQKIKPIILVGIENTQRRRDLTGPTKVKQDKKIAPVVGGAEAFRMFIKDELISEINTRYRTENAKVIIGESLAGLFVTETFFIMPGLFDAYIAFDPSLWWNKQYLINQASAYLNNIQSKKIFWFAASGEPSISEPTNQLADILKLNTLQNIIWHYSPEPNEKHSTIFRAAKEKALIWTLNKL